HEFLNHPRVSPTDGRLAFKDWGEAFFTRASSVVARDREGFDGGAYEMAWASKGEEVWVTDVAAPHQTDIKALRANGKERLIVRLPGDYVLYDIFEDAVLLGRLLESTEVLASGPGEAAGRGLSQSAKSSAAGLSADGSTLVFNDVSQDFFGA